MDWAGNPDEKRSRCMSLVGRRASCSAPPPTPYSLEANFSIRTFSLAPVSPSWGHVSDFWSDPWPPILKILDQRGLLPSSSRTEPVFQEIILLSAAYASEVDIQGHALWRYLGPWCALKTYLTGGLLPCIQRSSDGLVFMKPSFGAF